MKLQTKILLITLPAIFIGISALAGWSIHIQRSALQDAANHYLDGVVNAPQMTVAARKIIYGAVAVAFMVAMAIMRALTLVFRRMVKQPIDHMRAIADALIAQHAVAPVQTGATDEIGQLVHKFETMAHKIERSRVKLRKWDDKLKTAVALRTADLDAANRKLVAATEAKTQALIALESKEQAFRENETRFAGIIEGADVGVWEWNVATGETVFNERWAQIIGYSLQELAPVSIETWVKLAHPDDLERSSALLKRHFDGELDFYECEARMRHKNGDWVWVKDRGRVITRTPDGQPLLMYGIHSDITRRKQDHAALLELEKRLALAQKMEAIGSLASGIVHDFNNILWHIMGLSELLLEDIPQNDVAHGYVQKILDAAGRAADLVNQILAFSRRPETANLPIRLQPILKEVIKLCRSTIPAHIDLADDISQTCGPVLADPIHIHQIAVNLVTNAYHAVDACAGKIRLSLQETILNGHSLPKHLPDGDYAVLTVSDSGDGIDADLLDAIFDPCFTTKPPGKGTGLGLATVRRIVRGYHGDVLVHSQKGQGATFSVFLPLANEDEKNADDRPRQSVVGGDERILLVDDEHMTAHVQTELLQRLGYTVVSHTSAPAALARFKQAPDDFDLVITDMTMPGMTGADLATEILAVRPTIPIILCTGCSEKIEARRAESIGIKAFKLKPIKAADMAQTIRELLDEVVT